jgi:hypothetical protein
MCYSSSSWWAAAGMAWKHLLAASVNYAQVHAGSLGGFWMQVCAARLRPGASVAAGAGGSLLAARLRQRHTPVLHRLGPQVDDKQDCRLMSGSWMSQLFAQDAASAAILRLNAVGIVFGAVVKYKHCIQLVHTFWRGWAHSERRHARRHSRKVWPCIHIEPRQRQRAMHQTKREAHLNCELREPSSWRIRFTSAAPPAGSTACAAALGWAGSTACAAALGWAEAGAIDASQKLGRFVFTVQRAWQQQPTVPCLQEAALNSKAAEALEPDLAQLR